MKGGNLLRKPEKHDKNDSLTLVLIYHPTLNKVPKILQKTHRHTVRSPRLKELLPSPSRVAFHNAKTLKDHLVKQS